ncbi:MAG: RNA polymerase sigma factor [Oscillochloridaceae bacterium umkhey_bin13]
MSTLPTPTKPVLRDMLLATLQTCCAEEQARYQRDPTQDASACCIEIIRRAATAQDDAAFAALLAIARPFVQAACSHDLRHAYDDLQAEVDTRLFKKFYRGEQPFQASHFGAFVNYVKLTAKSAEFLLRKAQPADESLEDLYGVTGYEPPTPGPEDLVERRMRFERYLELLPTPAHREAFYHRFALGQDSAEVAAALGLSKPEVFRLVEQAIVILAKIPEVRELLEA